MIDVKIYLKNGCVVEFVSEFIESAKNIDGSYGRLEWKNVNGEETLLSIDLKEIAAITYKERKT